MRLTLFVTLSFLMLSTAHADTVAGLDENDSRLVILEDLNSYRGVHLNGVFSEAHWIQGNKCTMYTVVSDGDGSVVDSLPRNSSFTLWSRLRFHGQLEFNVQPFFGQGNYVHIRCQPGFLNMETKTRDIERDLGNKIQIIE